MSAEAKKKPESATEASPGTSVEQIRDIIFGAQMRDYEGRFEALSQRLQDSIDELRQEMERRFKASDKSLGQERDARESDVELLKRLLAAAEQQLGSEITAARQELSANLGSASDDLSHRKADRELLANLFREAAMQIEAGQIENGRPSTESKRGKKS
jgi:hypothetical protein